MATSRKYIVSMLAVEIILLTLGCSGSPLGLDNTAYCNAVQRKHGFVRYPLGTIGVWSTESGDLADVMTRVPRIYSCLNSISIKNAKDDWRSTITGDPSLLTVKYSANKPSGTTRVDITTTPHVSVFKVAFPAGNEKKYLVFDFSKTGVEAFWGLNKWTDRSVTRIDGRTIQASVGESGRKHAYYLIKFDAPSTGFGTINSSNTILDGATNVVGIKLGVYVQFNAPAITVAVAESFTSFEKAQECLTSEFADFDTIHKKSHAAWNEVLGHVEIDGTENNKRMAYTALYSIFANIINADDGSCYASYCAHPRSVSSSTYWQFVGGYQNCDFDNSRTTYPFLMLVYPEVMADCLGTFLARYKRDGCFSGDACLYTGPQGSKYNIRYAPTVAATAYEYGIQGDYAELYDALKANVNNVKCVPASLFERGFVSQAPDDPFPCSRTLELSAASYAMAVLAKANCDSEMVQKYLGASKSYTNLWDQQNQVFRVRNANGSWGKMDNTNWTWNPNPQGLFEGTSKDYSFDVPFDPDGLINLPGQDNFVSRIVQYCLEDTWFNDYQYICPYLLYYADAPDAAEKIIRNTWVPFFQEGVMYEGVNAKPPHNGWNEHYTSNSAWLICSMLGLYPVPSPPGQFIISSPSITKAIIHRGNKDIVVQTVNNSDKNIYIKNIKVDGKIYPCYMLPAKRLTHGAKIELEMTDDSSAGLGDLYISSSDGFVTDAELLAATHLKCTVESAAGFATTRIHCCSKPGIILINGLKNDRWSYDCVKRSVAIESCGTAAIEVSLAQ